MRVSSGASLFEALNRLEAHQPRPFIAPILDSDTTEVFVVQDGFPYGFRIQDSPPGWWKIGPHPGKRVGRANLEREATPDEYLRFLSSLRHINIIMLYPLSNTTWLCIPYNASDASQKGWKEATPRPIHLVRGQPVPLDPVSAGVLGGNLLFHLYPYLSRETTPDMLRARALVQDRLDSLRKVREHARQQQALIEDRKRVEGEFKYQLSLVGAELLDWSNGREGYNVTWEYAGARHTATVRRSGMAISAGICMEGTDSEHDLASLALAMQRARELHRFDMEDNLWI